MLGQGTIGVVGISGAELDVVHDGKPMRLAPGAETLDADQPRLVQRPIARRGDFELVLKPETFCLPGIDAARALIDLPDAFQEQQVPLVEEALALVERHQPLIFEHLCELLRVIAFKPAATGDYSNVSFSDLPGAFVLSAVKEPYWVADAFIHEFLHTACSSSSIAGNFSKESSRAKTRNRGTSILPGAMTCVR